MARLRGKNNETSRPKNKRNDVIIFKKKNKNNI